VPFTTQVAATATPDLFQLARLLTDQAVVAVATVELNTARIFLLHQGGLRELRQLADDPKYYHRVRSATAMSQAHYQRHARQVRERFASDVARDIEQLVAREHVTQVILAGEVEALPLIRAALSPSVAKLVHVIPRSLAAGAAEFTVPAADILDEIQPLLHEAKAERDRSVIERLVEAIQSDRLGVAGLEPTYRALTNGQVETLILLAGDTQSPAEPAKMSSETRAELIALATRTDAELAMVHDSPVLRRLGDVGALLRYRSAPIESEPDSASQPTV
jgi:stalled ribosome rescue protein Dom34